MRQRWLGKWPALSIAFSLALLFLLGSGCELPIPEANRTLPFEPKSFQLESFGHPLHVLVLGDFGWGGKGQFEVARAIATIHQGTPFHFGITVGDNFYNRGVTSVNDRKWTQRWEEPYGGLGIRFYPTLGNHDYYGNVKAQLDYRSPNNNWQFPARQYSFTVGDAEFFALDTMDPNPEQMRWLDKAIGSSNAKWKIVYGHHPVYSAGKHGDNEALEQSLLPLIRGRAIIYLAGHDHDMQHLQPVDGTHFFISGGGGARLRDPKRHPRTIFAKGVYGFSSLSIHHSYIEVKMYDGAGKVIYQTRLGEESALHRPPTHWMKGTVPLSEAMQVAR